MKKYILAGLSVIAAMLCLATAYAENFESEYDITLLNCGEFPEYHSIAEENVSLQEDIAAKLESRQEEINVQTDLSAEDLGLVFETAVNANPLIDYVRDVVCISETDGGYTIHPIYDEAAASLMDNSYSEELNKILSCVDSTMSDADKCLAVHNYMVTHYEYDLTYNNSTMRRLLTTGRGVCQAYADTYTYIMNALGIKCVTVSSSSMNHAWNMVRLDGEWYHVDVTWDDPVEDVYGIIKSYMYFLLSDDAISEYNHYGWSSSYTADSTKYENCFWADLWDNVMYYKNGYWYYYYDGGVYCGRITDNSASKYKSVSNGVYLQYTAIYNDYIYDLNYWYGSYVLVRTNIDSGDWEIIYTYDDYDYNTATWYMSGFLVDEDGVSVYAPTSDFLSEYSDSISADYYTQKENYIYTIDVTETITKPEMNVSIVTDDCITSITASVPDGYTVYYTYLPFDSDISAEALYYYQSNASEYNGDVVIDYPGMYKVSFFGVKSDGGYTAVKDVIITNTYSGSVGTLNEKDITAIITDDGDTRVIDGRIVLNIDSNLTNVFADKSYSHNTNAISYQCFMAIYSGDAIVDVLQMSSSYNTKAYFKADNIVLPSNECTIKVFLWQTDSDGAQTMFPISCAAEIEV